MKSVLENIENENKYNNDNFREDNDEIDLREDNDNIVLRENNDDINFREDNDNSISEKDIIGIDEDHYAENNNNNNCK
ncbi:9930_t:CDS:1, partial [Funneliformis mosseae]